MEENRRDPEQLLEAVQRLDNKSQRGRLRVFLGMCPGVGKTFAMLKSGKEQENRGVLVAIGVVETHGRQDTEELVTKLRVLPRKEIEYKGAVLHEMDLDLILKEKPDLVLVDELAHTNAPSSRHLKRYQDVEEILSQGIDVYTTVNIQHIESRNDQVAQITGVSVKETVPDSFLENADQIEVIDLSPSELLLRLKEGKVYLGERAERAQQNFFKEEYLTALRELALRFTAERVDQDLHYQMTIKGIEGPWNTNERLLVAVSQSPSSVRLIRATRRMAYNLEAPWIALYVNNGEPLSTTDQEMLHKNLELSKELGAEIITITDADLSRAIQKVCREKNVTQIVMGRPDKRFFRDWITRGTLLDQLVRTTSKIDVHVIRAERAPAYRGFHLKFPKLTAGLVAYYNTAWFLAAISVICYLAQPYVGYKALGSVFLLTILVVASFTSRGPILFAAVISALVWNYFFIPPTFTFIITSWEDTMMVISFFVVALVAGLLTSRIRKQEAILENREERARNLYELAKNLSNAQDIQQILSVLISTVDRQFDAVSRVILTGQDGKIEKPSQYQMQEKDFAVAQWVFDNGKSAGWSTQTLSESTYLCLPMKGNSGAVGVFMFYPRKKQTTLSIEQKNFLETVIAQGAVAIERKQFREAAQATKIYEASEKLHQTLINSVSHELRTPITTIIGTSTALKDERIFNDPKARKALTEELVQAAQRLDRVVENLLDVSRLEKGTLQLKKEWFEVQDLISDVKNNLKDELIDRELKLQIESGSLIEGDFKLLQHAISNIVLNSVRYSPPGTAIEIQVRASQNTVSIAVKDSGSGIPQGLEHALFEKFYRLPGSAAGGIGLGLSIVKSIVELHGGKVTARNRSDTTGAIFEVILPVSPTPSKLQEALK